MRTLAAALAIVALGPSSTVRGQIQQIELSEPVAVLGEEENGSILSRPVDVVAGNGDTIYVVDNRDLVAVAFDGQGNELFRFGRDGEGPGEFRQPRSIEFTGHSVLVNDYGLMRIEEFSPAGVYERTIRLDLRPWSGLVAHGTDLYVSVQSEGELILRISLDDPERSEPVLTFSHAAFSEFTPMDKFRKGHTELGHSEDGLLVAFPALGRYMVIPWGASGDAVPIIEPACDLLDVEWKRIEQLIEDTGGAAGARMFNTIAEWSSDTILLELRTGMAETFRAVAAIFDASSGREVGPRFVARDTRHGGLSILVGGRIAWINFAGSTVSIFELPRDDR